MSVAERGSGRMTYAKKKPFAEQDLRVTLHCAGKYNRKLHMKDLISPWSISKMQRLLP